MALLAATETGSQAKLAAAMIPSLVEQYIIGCPIGDLAPVGRGGQELPLTKMMALIVILMQQYVSKTRDDKDKTEIEGIPPDLSDPRVQEAVSEVMREAVDQRWDNRSFAVTTETGGSGDDRVNLTIFAQCEIKGRSWEEAVGELIASGVRKVKQATSNATRLSQTSRYSLEDFAKQRQELEKSGDIVRLSPRDEFLHFVAQEIAGGGQPPKSRRPEIEADEGKQVGKCLLVREAVGQLYRDGQLDMDFWICRKCTYPNHPNSIACRGYVNLSTVRWTLEKREELASFCRMP